MSAPKAEENAALRPGLEGHADTRVTEALTAPALGSGSLDVYATPAMVALMEKAAVAAVEPHLAPGEATVGVHLDVAHKAATPVGIAVSAKATLTAVAGRKLTFSIVARDTVEVIGEATHVRIVVDGARFAAKLAAKETARTEL